MRGAIEEILACERSRRDPCVFYWVTRDPGTGAVRCDCRGFAFRRHCRQVDAYERAHATGGSDARADAHHGE